jgi:hypothetical protein
MTMVNLAHDSGFYSVELPEDRNERKYTYVLIWLSVINEAQCDYLPVNGETAVNAWMSILSLL